MDGMIHAALGKHVRLEFTPPVDGGAPLFGGSVDADVFAEDLALRRVVFRRAIPHTHSKADYFVVAFDAIKSVLVLRDSEVAHAAPNLGAGVVARRVEDGRRREERRLETKGLGVSEQEQRLFDELLKTCVARRRPPPLVNRCPPLPTPHTPPS